MTHTLVAPMTDDASTVGTLERVVIVRTDDYWASVAETLTDGLVPRHPTVLVLFAISSAQFAEIHDRIERTSLYYPAGWQLTTGGAPVLHDDMLVADDMDAVDDATLIAAVRSRLSVAQVDVADGRLADALGPDTSQAAIDAVARHTWVSFGGWCGPSLGLRRLLGPQQRLAFDYMLSSLPGVDRAVFGDGGGYVPPRPFPLREVQFNRADEVAARDIIGSEHWALPGFIHIHDRFDIDPDVWEHLEARLERTRRLLRTHEGPLFVIRSITGPSWRAERDLLVDLRDRLRALNPACDARFVVIVSSQLCGTVRLAPIAPGIDTWSTQGAFGSLDDTGLPFVRYEAEHARILCRIALDDERTGPDGPWPPPPDLPAHELREHNEHWIF